MRVSLTMIVRDEEADLPLCLDSVASLVDEIIVVDTGSKDRTRDVAARRGARVIDFAWRDDFAAARNESLRHATGEWIFWLDADDRLDPDNQQRLRRLFASLADENVGYVMYCRGPIRPDTNPGPLLTHTRLFRNHSAIRWQYRIHEQITPAILRSGGQERLTDVVIEHTGYEDAERLQQKMERNLRLLRLQDAEQPNDPFTLYNLGRTHLGLKQPAEALPYFQRSLALWPRSDRLLRELHCLQVMALRQLGRREEALGVCVAGRRSFPDETELIVQEGILRNELGDLAGAELALVTAWRGPAGPWRDGLDPRLHREQAMFHLGLVYRKQGRFAEAEALWRELVEQRVNYLDAWMALADLWLAQQRAAELLTAAARLEWQPLGGVAATLLRSRFHLARNEFDSARALLAAALANAPDSLWLRIAHARLLCQEGQDWQAAEQAVLEVLRLDPHYEPARRNLAWLRSRQAVEQRNT
ncbi:MAG: glycosyltransferase [Gemmataceae bacterium]|nr:glycosyltransferase [Gemmataceae bacterium]MDW8265819.1 glycosyltransferase [Gemmataceae bacterium]